MVFLPGTEDTQFSYLEYQVFMLCLAGMICTSIATVEVALNRFQVLPLLFPGVFTVRDRRFFFFTYDISDGALGKRIRAEAKMLVRINLCVVLSYLWQRCVLETTQTVGTEFPLRQCEQDHDCFASKFHMQTFFNREYEAIDCKGPQTDFPSRVVVSCIRFIPPSANTWMMHLAIAHSVTQLNFKSYEVLVWIAGNSRWIRRLLGALIFISLSVFVGLFISGVFSEFVSSWLSFVMSLYIPMFLHKVWKTSKALEIFWREDCCKVQDSIEANLDAAFRDIEQSAARAAKAGSQELLSPAASTPRGARGYQLGMPLGSASFFHKIVAGIRRPYLPSLLRNKMRDKGHSNASSPTNRCFDEEGGAGPSSLRGGAQAAFFDEPHASWDLNELPLEALLQPMQPTHEGRPAALRGRDAPQAGRPQGARSRAAAQSPARSPARSAAQGGGRCSPRCRGRSPRARGEGPRAAI